MPLKLKTPLLTDTSPARVPGIMLIAGTVLAFNHVLTSGLTRVPVELSSWLASADSGLVLSLLPLLSFAAGAVLCLALVARPMRQAHQVRESQLRRMQERLKAQNHELHRQATRDPMLAIANRGEFERVLALEWRRAARERQPLSLLMIDVDHFKAFNDTYGHLQGDRCLQEVAAALKAVTERPGDLVARYGGEEMAILLPRTGLQGAIHLAQRIHAALAKRAVAFPVSPVADHVTVSIGAASLLPVRDASAQALIQQADEGLYAAKAKGRNRTESVSHLRLIAAVA